jgi:hypothetical protein
LLLSYSSKKMNRLIICHMAFSTLSSVFFYIFCFNRKSISLCVLISSSFYSCVEWVFFVLHKLTMMQPLQLFLTFYSFFFIISSPSTLHFTLEFKILRFDFNFFFLHSLPSRSLFHLISHFHGSKYDRFNLDSEAFYWFHVGPYCILWAVSELTIFSSPSLSRFLDFT